MKSVRGVGYNLGGKYDSHNGRHPTDAYEVWSNMLARCYCQKTQQRQSAYIGVTVCDDWHDYQSFADWYYSQEFKGKGYQLDKDLLLLKNKMYSPEVCCLVPQEINKLLLSNPSRRGKYPQGVCYNKQKKRYQANISMNGVATHLGRFDCPQEAHQAYRVAKEAYVKERALHWRDRIAPEVYEALMSWRLT